VPVVCKLDTADIQFQKACPLPLIHEIRVGGYSKLIVGGKAGLTAIITGQQTGSVSTGGFVCKRATLRQPNSGAQVQRG
jgi:hypothetical protein